MSIVVRFTPAGLTAEQYGKAVRMLEDQGAFPPRASTTTSASARTVTSG